MYILCIAFTIALLLSLLISVGNSVEAKREKERINKIVSELTILWSVLQNQISDIKKQNEKRAGGYDGRIN